MRWLAGVLAGSIAIASAPTVAHATTVVPITVEDLAARSDDVVVATVRAAQSQWLGHRIVTDYDLEVQSVVRGVLATSSHITLRLPGGVVGRIGQQVPGVPSPAVGTAYLFFVQRAANEQGLYYVTHLTASVLPLALGSTGTVTVLPAAEGMIVPRTGPTTGATAATTMVRAGVELSALVGTLRSVR